LSFFHFTVILLSFWEWENEELALGNLFLGLPGRGVVSRLKVQAWGEAGSKTGWAGWGRGEMARGGGSGPGSGVDLETQKMQLYQHASLFFCIFFASFCMFFAFPKPGVIFLSCFLHFLRPGLPSSPLA